MADLERYHAIGKELEERLRLKTFPVAIKLLTSEAEAPEQAFRPLRDTGKHLSLCQAFQLARRDGKTVVMAGNDNWCFEPVVGYGFEAPPAPFMEGHNRYPRDVRTLEAGSNYAEEFPKLPAGKYWGVTAAPLTETPFEPDMVMIYCDTSQLSLALLGRECKDGRNLKTAISSHAACVYSVVPVLLEQKAQVALPCRGDHYHAMAGDEEMIFTVPLVELDDLIEGLRYVNRTGSKLPRAYTMLPEYKLPDAYRKIAEGMEYLKPQ